MLLAIGSECDETGNALGMRRMRIGEGVAEDTLSVIVPRVPKHCKCDVLEAWWPRGGEEVFYRDLKWMK